MEFFNEHKEETKLPNSELATERALDNLIDPGTGRLKGKELPSVGKNLGPKHGKGFGPGHGYDKTFD